MTVGGDYAADSKVPGWGRIALSAQQVALMAVFADAGPRVVGRDEMRRRLGLGHCDPRRCDALICELRRAIGPDAIVTVRGRGWRSTAPMPAVEYPAPVPA